MFTASTDMAQLRAKGMQAYGIGPAMTSEDFAQHGWHSDVERLSEESLYQFVEIRMDSCVQRGVPFVGSTNPLGGPTANGADASLMLDGARLICIVTPLHFTFQPIGPA